MWGAESQLPITLIDSCSAVKVLLLREDRTSSTAPLVPLVHWQDFCRTCGRWRALGRAKDRFQCMCRVRVNFTHFTDAKILQHSYVWERQAIFVRTVGIMPLSLPFMPTPYLSRLNFIVMIFAFCAAFWRMLGSKEMERTIKCRICTGGSVKDFSGWP